MTSNRRIVVTGAAGFLGAAAARRLVGQGHEVLAWVRPASDPWRLAGIGPLELLRLDLGDVLTPSGLRAAQAALAAFRPEAVLHAAWHGTRAGSRDDPRQIDNVTSCIELVRIAGASGARRFVALGSQAEYGRQDGVITEETPTRPASLYGAAKLACGHLSLALARKLGLSAAWVRVFSVYGPGERSGSLVSDLARALKERRSFPVGTGETLWDYLYEDDAACALARLVLRDDAVGFFNLASGTAVPVREVMARIRDLVAPGTPLPLGSKPTAPDDLPRLEADVSRIRRSLAWQPETGLDQGLAWTVAALVGERPGIVATDG